jgi:hypothetical protein
MPFLRPRADLSRHGDAPVNRAAAATSFFARRWRGEVSIPGLLWRDMVVVGSIVNLAASVLALVLVAQGVPAGVAAAVHFAPLPYNGFLLASLWRNPRRTAITSAVAALWFLGASLL